MDNKNKQDYLKTNIEIVEFAIRKWKILLGVAIFSGVFGYIFSGPAFVAPKFKSEAAIYPANLGEYGSETELEQMQQYLQSNAIRDTLIRKFNLYDEYEIDPSIKHAKTYVYQAYSEHVSFDETRLESVHIEVYSTDPVKAKRMVDEIILQADNNVRRTQKGKYIENVEISKQYLDVKRKQVDSLEKQIRNYAVKYGILDYESQSERVTEKYLDFLLSGKKGADFEKAEELYKNLQEYGPLVHSLRLQMEEVSEEYTDRQNWYEQAVRDLNKYQTYSYVLVSPEIADKKSSPIRWLIVTSAIAAAVGFVFALLLILGYQNR